MILGVCKLTNMSDCRCEDARQMTESMISTSKYAQAGSNPCVCAALSNCEWALLSVPNDGEVRLMSALPKVL